MLRKHSCKTLLIYAVVALMASAQAACSKGKPAGADDRQMLSVSIEPQRKILEELAGDNFSVVTVLTNGANPESFEPSVAQRMAISDSRAFFPVGYLPFEKSVEGALKSGVPVYDTSRGIEVLTGTHSHHGHDEATEADPHTWTSVRNAKIIAANMLAALQELDPDNADIYASRYNSMAHRLDSLDAAIGAKLAAAGAHAFAVWHPSLSYFARDYGLHQLAVGQESKEVSVARLRDIVNEAREDSVRVLFFQREFDARQAQSLSREIGARIVTISPLSYDWEAELTAIADELSK